MPNKLKEGEEYKLTKSFAIEISIYDEFNINCGNLGSNPSLEIRKMIIQFNRDQKKVKQ